MFQIDKLTIKNSLKYRNKVYILSFSGGKNSTAMLFKLLENNWPIDFIVYCDTGAEYPEMYEHISMVNKKLKTYYGCHVLHIHPEHDFFYYVSKYKRKRGNNKGLPYGFPSSKCRWCTSMLKVNPLNKFKKQLCDAVEEKILFVDYIGFSIDEMRRADRIKRKETRFQQYRFPLIEYGMSERSILDYCYSLGFKWNGLYEFLVRTSCYVCPFKSNFELRYLILRRGELWRQIKEIETALRALGVKTWKFQQRRSTVEIEKELLGQRALFDIGDLHVCHQ